MVVGPPSTITMWFACATKGPRARHRLFAAANPYATALHARPSSALHGPGVTHAWGLDRRDATVGYRCAPRLCLALATQRGPCADRRTAEFRALSVLYATSRALRALPVFRSEVRMLAHRRTALPKALPPPVAKAMFSDRRSPASSGAVTVGHQPLACLPSRFGRNIVRMPISGRNEHTL